MSTYQPAPSRRLNPPGSEAFLSCVTYRWLYGEKKQLFIRQLDFDIQALGDAAAAAIGSSECDSIQVLAEGGLNRLFSILMTDGKEVVARIPFRNAGPRRLTTQSEVATIDFLRSRLQAPIPKILAWQASSDNPVGCEYILMERCPGDPLGHHMHAIRDKSLLTQIADFQIKLSSVRFSQYGSIFYKDHVSPELQNRPLYAEGEPEDHCSERFRIGPSVERRFYRRERASMNLDRGPWRDTQSYINAVAAAEVSWIQSYSDSSDARRQNGAYNTSEQHISLLAQWTRLAPAIIPSDPRLLDPVLVHPDLHAANVMLNTGRGIVTKPSIFAVNGIIDWQNAMVRPLFEATLPAFLEDPEEGEIDVQPGSISDPPVLPPALETYDENRRSLALAIHCYLSRLHSSQPALVFAMKNKHINLLRHAIYFSSHTWSDGLPNLDRVLEQLCAGYGTTFPAHTSHPTCPIDFSLDNEARERRATEYHEYVGAELIVESMARRLMGQAGFDVNASGSVNADEFEEAQEEANRVFEYLTGKMGGGGRGMFSKRLWTFRDNRFDLMSESCVD
ncbi:hypothetical protein BDV93DRAFT_557595 [Ceratobasidium sp. AG-I]|nr:hypothetical protein BDV93DRAFT_557595 [Ceratobasidium sp. AG-I]